MKKIILLAMVFRVLAFYLPQSLFAASETPKEARITGILHLGSIPMAPLQPPGSIQQSGPQPNETGYWLRLDKPIYVLKGSKSEASTDVVVLRVPAELMEKTKILDDRYVVVVGLMNCTGNWVVGAHCNMLVEQIDIADTRRCDLKPDHGPCKAIFWKYYYDQTRKKCEKFEYGGCGGVVPFETKEECIGTCEGK